MIVEGIEEKGFSGKITATYNIKKLDINDKNIDILLPNNSSYMKSGAKPIPIITYSFNGKVWNLREGVDYSLKYINNKSQNSSKVPTLKITGLGNFSGTIMKTYSITEQDIGYLTMTVTDKIYNANKKGSYYLVEPKIYDKDGQLLKKNKDYTVSYINMNTGKEIYKNDIIANGTEILVTASGKDNYNGTLSTSYYVRTTKDINKVAADKIINQQYTGSALKPECALYTKNGSDKIYLTEGTDYIVVGYYNNIKKGKASILIKGIGEYSGSKIVTFKIVAVNNQSIWEGIFN